MTVQTVHLPCIWQHTTMHAPRMTVHPCILPYRGVHGAGCRSTRRLLPEGRQLNEKAYPLCRERLRWVPALPHEAGYTLGGHR